MEKMNVHSSRVEWIDLAKGIGIILVILGHAMGSTLDSFNVFSKPGFWYDCFRIIYGFHMSLFFFLSGIFVRASLKKSNYIQKKIISIAMPYVIWSFITASVMQLAGSLTNNGLGIKDALFCLVSPFSEYWFLYVLFLCFVAFIVVSKISSKWFLLLLTVVFYIVSPWFEHVWIIGTFLRSFSAFLLGDIFSSLLRRIDKNTFNRTLNITIMVIFLVVNFVMLMFVPLQGVWYLEYSGLTALIGIMLTISVAMFISNIGSARIKKIFSNLGKNSMEIYVVHLIPLAGARAILEHVVKSNNIGVIIIVSFMVGLLFSVFAYKIALRFKLGQIIFGKISLSR